MKIYTEQLIRNTDAEIVEQFIEEKLELAEEKMKNSSEEYIDLGDNCYIQVTTNTTEKATVTTNSNTPGTQTVWESYGDHNFTVFYQVHLGVICFQLHLSNDYTLSEDGIEITEADSWVDYSGLASASAKSAKITKAEAEEGETASSNSIYSLEVGIDPVTLAKNFKMYNKLKCSDIDTTEEEVKVVQSWNGEWL